MKNRNVTLSISEELLRASKRYAQKSGTSLNKMIRDFLAKTAQAQPFDTDCEDLMRALDEASRKAKPAKWKREDAYDV
jgi:antitoxin component of RelBE/YafQ-DinJ toxin-antitoxin module